jgi:hypothetical protein
VPGVFTIVSFAVTALVIGLAGKSCDEEGRRAATDLEHRLQEHREKLSLIQSEIDAIDQRMYRVAKVIEHATR